MRVPALVAAGLVAVLSAPASAVGTPGPFASVIAHGETKSHIYDNNPAGADCIQLAVTYTVSLTYAPPSDTLTLSAGGQTATGSNGSARVSFWGSYCDSFGISVSGTSVGARAAYVVTAGTGSQTSE